MKVCENCGIEHDGTYGSGRFCSDKCARGFSTKAKRAEINQKISKKLKKIKYCKSCGIEVNGRQLLCNDCHNFFQYDRMFRKFNIEETNIKLANSKVLSIIKNEYFVNKLSLIQLRDKYKIQFNTVHFFLKKNGITLRNNEDSTRLAYELGRLSPGSNNKYKHGEHISWNGKSYHLRSSYELEYAKELDSYKIDYEVEKKRIKYYDSILQKDRIAVADFYIPSLNMIVEIKSSYTLDLQNIKDKFKAYRKLGFETKLIVDKKEFLFNND